MSDSYFECPRCGDEFRSDNEQEKTVIADHGHCWSCKVAWQHGEWSEQEENGD